MASSWGSSWLSRWGGSWGLIQSDRGGDGFSRRQRRQPLTREQLYRLFGVKDEERQAPPVPTTQKQKAIARRVVREIEAGGGLLAPVKREVAQIVRTEVARVWQPGTDWRALANAMQAVMQRAAEEAERIEREIEDEDEFILMMAA